VGAKVFRGAEEVFVVVLGWSTGFSPVKKYSKFQRALALGLFVLAARLQISVKPPNPINLAAQGHRPWRTS
jgi:hypothetical protein